MGGVAIGGFMGTGKTTLGRRLAAALGLPFVDSDAVLVARFGPIAAQFEQAGEATFRTRECTVITEICAGPDVVLATGGGAWTDAKNRALLGDRFATVVLMAELDTIRHRLGDDRERPLWTDGIEVLFKARRGAYADASVHLQVDEGTPDELVRTLLLKLGKPAAHRVDVRVALGPRSYDVVLTTAAWADLPQALSLALPECDQAVVISDSTVAPLWYAPVSAALSAAGWRHRLLTFTAGEAQKTVQTWQQLLTDVLQSGFDRRTAIVALGGGVVGDLAGFVSATAMRGVPFVQIPTTLLSLVDSSVGGKTGLNHAGGKNLVGAFHQPRLVFGALRALTTLPEAERIAGLGEVLKTALLGDADLLDFVEENAEKLRRGDAKICADVVARCVAIKAKIVADDELESGVRAYLNAGHTVAHAYESVLPSGAIRHGEAVALGLIAETAWAIRERHCEDRGLDRRLVRIAGLLGLPTTPPEVPLQALVGAMQLDKKASSDTIGVPVPVRAGSMKLVRVPRSQLFALVSGSP